MTMQASKSRELHMIGKDILLAASCLRRAADRAVEAGVTLPDNLPHLASLLEVEGSSMQTEVLVPLNRIATWAFRPCRHEWFDDHRFVRAIEQLTCHAIYDLRLDVLAIRTLTNNPFEQRDRRQAETDRTACESACTKQ